MITSNEEVENMLTRWNMKLPFIAESDWSCIWISVTKASLGCVHAKVNKLISIMQFHATMNTLRMRYDNRKEIELSALLVFMPWRVLRTTLRSAIPSNFPQASALNSLNCIWESMRNVSITFLCNLPLTASISFLPSSTRQPDEWIYRSQFS